MLYNNFSAYLKNKYGKEIRKICIDGGFTCPNRDGKCGTGGCIFCGERGAGEHIDGWVSITEQVKTALARGKSEGYIAYFQNFTNTYADVATLKERYDAALFDDRIVALSIGTRPDCIDDQIAELIASYKERLDVWVELGLQSASNTTAQIINRGYTTEIFGRAAAILEKHGIPYVVHLIIGLPGENSESIKRTCDFLSGYSIYGIKIHSLYVMAGTRLAEMYRAGEYEPIGEDEYVEGVIYVLTHINPETVVHRITGDCPDGMLLAPAWSREKSRIIEKIRSTMSARGLYQGMYFDKIE